ncbi:MAG: hypothetical protein ABI904_22760 [Chloroflexota bacterium]
MKLDIGLENQQLYQRRKADNILPAPLGEGQTDMPIIRLNQGEVPPADQSSPSG